MNSCLRLNCGLLMLAAALAVSRAAADSPTPEDAQKWRQLMTDTTKALKANNVAESVRLCDEAIDLAGKFGPADARLSSSQVLRAEVYMWQKKNDQAEQTFKLAVASCEKATGSNSLAVVHPLSSLANFYYFVLVRYDKVVPLFQRIEKIVENSPESNSRDIIMWSRNLGMIYQQTGQYALGEPMFNKAVALAETTDPEWLPHELLTEADFYRAWSKYSQAEALALRALSIREKAMPPDAGVDAQLDVAVCLNGLGAIYLDWSKPEKAEAAYRRSLSILRKFMSPDQSDLAPHFAGLAAALRAQGRYDQAEPFYQQALAITEKNMGSDGLETAAMLEKYAGLLTDMKKPAAAKTLLARAEMIRKQNATASK